MDRPPRLLVYSDNPIAGNNGTGAIFLRNFARYPTDRLCNAFTGDPAVATLPLTLDLGRGRWPSTPGERLRAGPLRLWNRTVRQFGRPAWQRALPASRTVIAAALRQSPFVPDLVYAICEQAGQLAIVEAIMAGLPSSPPLLLHFHDFWPAANARFAPLLRRLVSRPSAIWTVSRPIADYIERTTGRSAWVDPQLHIELPAQAKLHHRPADQGLRLVLLGNVWDPRLLQDVQAIWRWCRDRLPGLAPVQWYCHPAGVAQLRAGGYTPEPEIVPQGFLRETELWSMLAEADLALIPFSREAVPATDYERYSMPSRLTELASAGLPVFALAGPTTPVGEYILAKQIGGCSPAAHTEATGRLLLSLLLDRTQREIYGQRARQVAESEFPLATFQEQLYDRLAAIAGGHGA